MLVLSWNLFPVTPGKLAVLDLRGSQGRCQIEFQCCCFFLTLFLLSAVDTFDRGRRGLRRSEWDFSTEGRFAPLPRPACEQLRRRGPQGERDLPSLSRPASPSSHLSSTTPASDTDLEPSTVHLPQLATALHSPTVVKSKDQR